LGPFLRTRKWGSGIFVGKSGVRFFYFSSGGGCAKVVPNAHRRGDGLRRRIGLRRRRRGGGFWGVGMGWLHSGQRVVC